jgi:hypothetical protein
MRAKCERYAKVDKSRHLFGQPLDFARSAFSTRYTKVDTKSGYRADPTGFFPGAKVDIFPATASHPEKSTPAAMRRNQR